MAIQPPQETDQATRASESLAMPKIHVHVTGKSSIGLWMENCLPRPKQSTEKEAEAPVGLARPDPASPSLRSQPGDDITAWLLGCSSHRHPHFRRSTVRWVFRIGITINHWVRSDHSPVKGSHKPPGAGQ